MQNESNRASSRSRAFCFTWNNYPDSYQATLDSLEAKYYVVGKETAPTTGTPHLQAYVVWRNARSLSSVRGKLPGCHVSIARGNAQQNKDYCSKGGDFLEFGDQPLSREQIGRAEADRWAAAWTHAKSGDIENIDPDIRVRYYAAIKRIGQDYLPSVPPLDDVCGTWIYGQSGCGKTRAVLAAYPDCFIKPRNKWWDGYQREHVVLVDDIDIFDRQLGGSLKHWADFAPFVAEVKGTSQRIRPSKLIVTSQYTIEEIWEDQQTRDALLRRFTVLRKVKDIPLVLN